MENKQKKKEKEIHFVRELVVDEWWSKKDGRVYLNWRIETGEIWTRLTPYDEIPIVEIKKPYETK